MTLRHIRIFLAVCDNDNSITKAAQELFLAQPSVSFAIAELEKYYGVKLFDRISRRLYITEAGRHFREYAVHIAELFNNMDMELRNSEAAGILRVGSSITIGSQFLPSYTETFSTLYPGVNVRVFIDSSDRLEDKLMKNELDFALIEGVVHETSLVAEDYLDDSLAVICSPRGPYSQGQILTLEQFKKQRFLLREHGSGTREEFESAVAAAGICINPAWESMSTTALINAAIHGLGIAVLPRRMISGPLERGLVISLTVENLEFKRKFRIIYHKDKFLTPMAKKFMDLCRNYELDYPMPKFNGLY